MIRNYIKIAWRNLIKNKVSSLINVSGLALGMSVATLIGLWIYDELSFDKYHQNYDRIALVIQNVTNNGNKRTLFQVPFPLGDELRKSYGSDFKHIVMSSGSETHILTFNDKKLSKSGYYMEPEALEMLNIKMLTGSNKDGLTDPSSILLSQSVAKAFFGDADPMGKIIKIDNKLNVKVTGVYLDLPYNSSFADLTYMAPWNLLVSDAKLKERKNPWRGNAFLLFIQLADNANMDKVSFKIRDVKIKKINRDELVQKPQLFLYPMSHWYLYPQFKNGVNVGGRIIYVWLFGIIAVFVLLLACINFMNLSTAKSEKRCKEVGIRKTIGSLRSQLILQFLIESLLVVAFAFILSLILVQLALPFLNEIADKKMSILWDHPLFWLLGLGFCLVTGIIAGSYPAFYLSSFRPVKVLKGIFKVGRFAVVPRKALVVLQFTVSAILIIGTFIVFRQIQFAKNRPIGYNRDGLVVMPMSNGSIHSQFTTVKDELMKTGAITAIAECESGTTDIYSTNSGFDWPGKDPALGVDFPNTKISLGYGKTVGWQFLEGRDFSEEFHTDSLAFVVNETAANYMGLKDPVGQTVKWDGTPYKVIGVIKDMIQESPYALVRPSFFHLSKDSLNYITIRINPKFSASEALVKIESVFRTFNPAQPFEYQFADEEYAKKFGNEERIGKLASLFAGLAIFLSCLGLFGMASFMAEQRIKEIGIRKVLGASVFNLWSLLSKDFVALVFISLVIATPLSYYFMSSWLQNYTYRSNVPWWIFAITGFGAVMLTLLTVSYQSIKAALINPVKSLNTE
jgi:putative ABC transport system permease protein